MTSPTNKKAYHDFTSNIIQSQIKHITAFLAFYNKQSQILHSKPRPCYWIIANFTFNLSFTVNLSNWNSAEYYLFNSTNPTQSQPPMPLTPTPVSLNLRRLCLLQCTHCIQRNTPNTRKQSPNPRKHTKIAETLLKVAVYPPKKKT